MITILDQITPALWRATWQATVLAVIVAVTVLALRDRLAARWRGLLWSVVLLRFLCVVAPASSWSLFNALSFEPEPTAQPMTTAVLIAPTSDPSSTAEPIAVEVPTSEHPQAVSGRSQPLADVQPLADIVVEPATDSREVSDVINTAQIVSADASHSTSEGKREASFGLIGARLLAVSWFVGFVICVARLLLAWAVLRRRLSACRPVSDPAVLSLLARIVQGMRLRHAPALLVTPELISPCVVGAWRTRIVVPELILTDLDSETLGQILAHELAHVRRGDMWANWLLLAVRTLHWFNPAAWWTVRQVQNERESACDELALSTLSDTTRNIYAQTIIDLANRLSPLPLALGIIGFLSVRRRLAARIQRVAHVPSVPPLPGSVVGVMLLLLALVGLTDATPKLAAVEPAASPPAKSNDRTDADIPAAKPEVADYRIKGVVSLLEREQDEQGNLRRKQTSSPKASVTLYAVRGILGAPEKIAETNTDDKGEFEFANLAPQRREMHFDRLNYGVVVRAEGRPPTIAPYWEPSDQQFGIGILPQMATLVGRVVDSNGKPVAGVTVAYNGIDDHPVPGVQNATTNKIGRFKIEDLAVWESFRPAGDGIPFTLTHPDYPKTRVSVPALPGEAVFTLPAGCVLTGIVTDEVTGRPVAGAMVTAEANKETRDDAHTLTDDAGRYRLMMADGNYNIMAEAKERVCTAITERDCRAGESVELPPIKLSQGGFIRGRVLNSATGKPIINASHGKRITLALYGPTYPPRKKIISPVALAEVDDEGRFVLRAAAGENFPYFVNEHGQRMAWDTRKQPPVVVKEGETTTFDMLIDPQRTPAEKMKAAGEILARLAKEKPQRVADIIAEFRKLNHTVDECEVWCLLMRELVAIGNDAVPQLCAELDQTEEQRMIRRLGFALRAIGDPRAVPALIRAIPKTLQPGQSDYGRIVEDPQLALFMQQHDLGNEGGNYFSFGRPIREVFGALHKLTGQNFSDDTLFSMHRSDDPNGFVLQRQLFRQQAERWQIWWEAHWQEFTKDEGYAKVKLPPDEPIATRPALTLGPNAKLGDGTIGATLSPPGENGSKFFDLDTGLEPQWPTHIPQKEETAGQGELALWAAQQGVDLMCVTYRALDGEQTYALRAFNMRLWEISQRDAENIESFVKSGKLPTGRPVGDLLFHQNKESGRYVPEENAAFVYVTREGGVGVVEVTDRVTRVENLNGTFGDPPRGVGFYKGVKFNYHPIVP